MNDSCFLPDRYLEPDVLSRGPHTSLVRAFDTTTDSPVALKVIHAPAWMTRDEADSYLGHAAEAVESHIAVTHTGLARTFGIERTDDSLIISREFVDGRPLSNLFDAHWALGQFEARRIAQEIGAALDALANAGLLHGSLKGQNVIVRESGEFVLTDAGTALAAKQFSVAGQACSFRTRQETGGDIRALASLVYQALTGIPADGSHGSGADLPRSMESAIRRALARDRAAFRSASQFAGALTPVPTLAVFRHVWQPAAAVGLLASLATVGGNAVSEARRSAGQARHHHAQPVEAATPVEVLLPNVLDTLAAGDAFALKRAVRRQGASVLANADVARLLDLSGAQQAEIAACLAVHRERVGQVVETAARGGLVDSATVMAELRNDTNRRILTTLNATQRARWEQVETTSQADTLTP